MDVFYFPTLLDVFLDTTDNEASKLNDLSQCFYHQLRSDRNRFHAAALAKLILVFSYALRYAQLRRNFRI